MASRWDGKIGKIPRLDDRKAGRRFSPKLGEVEPELHECRERDYDKEKNEDATRGRPEGFLPEYSPDQIQQYKSQWERYQRGVELTIDGIVKEDKKLLYKFTSCNSLTGYWTVTVETGGATYLNIKKPVFQILCPKVIDFDVVDSDGDAFTWTQTRGKRTATLDGFTLSPTQSAPFGTTVPKLNILTLCLNGGCADDSPDPIVLNVQPEDQPELFESVTIYTTPTEIYGGIGFTQLEDKSLKVSGIPAPAYLQKAYVPSLAYNFGIHWNAPNSDSQYVVGYVIQQNTNGQYVDIANGSGFKYVGQFNAYYRIKTLFSSFGLDYSSVSEPIIYSVPAYNSFFGNNGNGNLSTVFGDDNVGSPSFNYLSNSFTDLPLAVQKLEYLDNCTSGISYAYLNNSFTDLPLSVQRIEPSTDTYTSGISFAFLRTDITDIPTGGVIIG